MRLHRFFVNQDLSDKTEVLVRDTSLYHQLKNVFRFTVGGQVILLDGSGYEHRALISSFGFGEVSFSIVAKRLSKNLPELELILFCSLIKKDKFEWILEKGTELGVSRFVPVITDRSEKKDLNFDRARRIIEESVEQSGRAVFPVLEDVVGLEKALSVEISKIVFDPKGDQFRPEHTNGRSVLGVFIGPEGGFTERELFLFKKTKIPIYALGKTVLRAETAAIAAATLILL